MIYLSAFHMYKGTSPVGHIFMASGFKSLLGYVVRMFHLSLCSITFGCHSANLAHLVQKPDLKSATFIFYLKIAYLNYL